MVQLSREESVVLLTCRPELDPADDERLAAIVRQPLEWPLVLWRAETFQTVPLLDHHLQRLGTERRDRNPLSRLGVEQTVEFADHRV